MIRVDGAYDNGRSRLLHERVLIIVLSPKVIPFTALLFGFTHLKAHVCTDLGHMSAEAFPAALELATTCKIFDEGLLDADVRNTHEHMFSLKVDSHVTAAQKLQLETENTLASLYKVAGIHEQMKGDEITVQQRFEHLQSELERAEVSARRKW